MARSVAGVAGLPQPSSCSWNLMARRLWSKILMVMPWLSLTACLAGRASCRPAKLDSVNPAGAYNTPQPLSRGRRRRRREAHPERTKRRQREYFKSCTRRDVLTRHHGHGGQQGRSPQQSAHPLHLQRHTRVSQWEAARKHALGGRLPSRGAPCRKHACPPTRGGGAGGGAQRATGCDLVLPRGPKPRPVVEIRPRKTAHQDPLEPQTEQAPFLGCGLETYNIFSLLSRAVSRFCLCTYASPKYPPRGPTRAGDPVQGLAGPHDRC
jgi:hypothetical protein